MKAAYLYSKLLGLLFLYFRFIFALRNMCSFCGWIRFLVWYLLFSVNCKSFQSPPVVGIGLLRQEPLVPRVGYNIIFTHSFSRDEGTALVRCNWCTGLSCRNVPFHNLLKILNFHTLVGCTVTTCNISVFNLCRISKLLHPLLEWYMNELFKSTLSLGTRPLHPFSMDGVSEKLVKKVPCGLMFYQIKAFNTLIYNTDYTI